MYQWPKFWVLGHVEKIQKFASCKPYNSVLKTRFLSFERFSDLKPKLANTENIPLNFDWLILIDFDKLQSWQKLLEPSQFFIETLLPKTHVFKTLA